MKKSGIAIQFLGVAALPFLMAACTPISENPLLTSEANQPSGHNVNMDPTSDELYVRSDAATVYNLSPQHRVDISGECFVSTFPKHSIKVYYGTTEIPATNIAAAVAEGNTGYCYQGRYNISLNTSGFGAGSYSLKVKITGVDSKGQVYENLSRGISNFTLNK